jgi:hypothetical protein
MSRAREVRAFFCASRSIRATVRHPFYRKQVTGLIDDGDVHVPADLLCSFLSCGVDATRIWKLNHNSISLPFA